MKRRPFSVQLLDDPNLPPDVLAHIAATHPECWDAILRHPSCYAALGDWIIGQRAMAQRPTLQPQPMPVHSLNGVNRLIARAPMLVLAASVLAILSVLAPLWSAQHIPAASFTPENVSRSSFFAVTMLVVMECVLLIIFVKQRWAVVCTGVLALIQGISAVVAGFILPWVGAGVSVRFGGIPLGAAGLVLLAGGILVLQSLREGFVSLYPRSASK